MPASRRDFIRLASVATVAGPTAVLAACADRDDAARADLGPIAGESDVRVLNAALALELTGIAAYSAGAAVLRGGAVRTSRTVLEQEREHAAGLARAIRDLGGTPNRPKSAREYARRFPALNERDDVLHFAVELENAALAAYLDAVPKLADRALRQTAAAIGTNEAEHLTLLLAELGEPAVAHPFPAGAPLT